MDRDRLKEVHKTETTESRVNEDFVDWLKNKGPTWLLIVLVALTAYLFLVRWRASQQTQHIQAWRALSDAEQSAFHASLESVADDYPRVDAIAVLARLHAAQLRLNAVQAGRILGATGPEDDTTLTEQDRELYLSGADRQYQAVLDADDGSLRMALHTINALNGRAAVAEARGDFEAARRHYLAAAERAGESYPHLAEQARKRAEGDPVRTDVTLPREDEVEAEPQVDRTLRPAMLDPALRDLLTPAP